MTDREAFISRWARRKREAAKGADRYRDTNLPVAEVADARPSEGEAESAIRDEVDASGASGESTFDLSKLPSIESITAETDIRPFLARGVPSALRQAALRKMWVADPAIRDFIEVAENQWDFNAPGEILGFDLSPPVGDIRGMVAQILGDRPSGEPVPDGAAAQQAANPPADESDPKDHRLPRAEVPDRPAVVEAAAEDRTSLAASQNGSAMPNLGLKRRSHGGAMPT